MGNRAVKRTPRLSWDALIHVYGGEEQLRQVIKKIRNASKSNKQLAETIELANKYLAGWRPDGFED